APHASSVDAVHGWLKSHGMPVQKEACHQSPAGDWVTGPLPPPVPPAVPTCAQAENMLGTVTHVLGVPRKHTQEGDILVRTTEYRDSLQAPAHLDKHIELIQPTTAFNRAKRQRTTFRFSPAHNAAPLSSDKNISLHACNTTITASCLKQLYNDVGFVPRAEDNTIAITAYSEQFANLAHLQAFYEEQVPQALNTYFTPVSVKDGLNSQHLSQAGAEANLDLQFGFGISYPIPRTFCSTDGRPLFIPDANTPTNTNESYSVVSNHPPTRG
ncbi:hypothetical protein EDB92DRAFT_1802191, partial [Lactarius akahatsu]